MRLCVPLALIAVLTLASGVSRASERPPQESSGKRDLLGAALVISCTVVQVSVLSATIVGMFRLDSGYHHGRSAFQALANCTLSISVVGYGLLLRDGTEKGELRAFGIGFLEAAAYLFPAPVDVHASLGAGSGAHLTSSGLPSSLTSEPQACRVHEQHEVQVRLP